MNRDELARRIAQRLEVFPAYQPTKKPAMAQEYTLVILRMLDEFGSELTFDAVTEAIEHAGSFPPTPAEIRTWAAVLKSKNHEELPELAPEMFQVIDARFGPQELIAKAEEFERDGLFDLAAQLRETATEIERSA